MKLLYVCKSLPHRFQGGIQSHIWKLSEWMIRKGHDVTILSGGGFFRNETRYEQAGRTIVEIPYLPGRHLPFLSVFMEEWGFNIAAERWLKQHATAYDLIHAQGRSGFLFAGKQGNTPLVTTIHGLVSVENAQSGRADTGSSWAIRQHQKWATHFERRSMQFSDRLIAVSSPLLDHMTHLVPKAGERTSVIPNGIDVPNSIYSETLPTEGGEKAPYNLLFVGRLDPIKGIFPLVEAMKQVRQNVYLTIVGDGPSRAELTQRIRQLNLSTRITLVGAQSATQVQDWMLRSMALVLPSFYESLPMVLMEANSCGKPVIASNTGGIPTLIKHGQNGFLVPVNQPNILACVIDDLVANPQRAQKMGDNGRRMMLENFSWARVSDATEGVYQSFCA
jgi:glycosyltransferase involved in cell wall biosynthesis